MQLFGDRQRLRILSIVAFGLLFTDGYALGDEPPPKGFSRLFNGKDLTGWCGRKHIDPSSVAALSSQQQAELLREGNASLDKHWRVAGSELVNDGEGAFCTTVEEFGDFELRLDWKLGSEETDSGVYLRGCPQVQIWCPTNAAKRKHDAHKGSGGLWNNSPGVPGKDPLVKADRPVGEWNMMEIRLVGDRVTVRLNGLVVVDNEQMSNYWNRDRELYERGPIQLQSHGGEIRFRHIDILRLDDDASSQEQLTQRIPGTDVKFEMISVPGGSFRMGSLVDEPGRHDDEGPQIDVRVAPFWINKHEVTWAEYKQYMRLVDVFERFEDAGIRQVKADSLVDAVTAPSRLYDPSFTYDAGEDPDLPAVSMTQYAAKQYTKWLSLLTGDFYRLPTEAEWEYACRAGSTSAYSFGENASDLAEQGWFYDNSEDRYAASKVGRLKPNAWGLHDMHGNVAEWVLDGYEANAYSRLASSSLTPVTDAIHWPTQPSGRVLRGGSWLSEDPAACRSAARLASDDEELKSYDPNRPQSPWWFASDEAQAIGFRVVRPVDPPPRSEWSHYWDADHPSIKKAANRRIDHEGKGERGIVDQRLPEAIETLDRGDK